MADVRLIILAIVAIIVIIIVIAIILYIVLQSDDSSDGGGSSEQECINAGLRWVDGACRSNNVCPEPFYDIGGVAGATGPFNYQCGIPNNIKNRIGATFQTNGTHSFRAVNINGDNFTSPDDVRTFWEGLGFSPDEISPGGGPNSNGCPDVSCSQGHGWFYQSIDSNSCTFFETGGNQFNAHVTPAGQGTNYNIDVNSWNALRRCADKCLEDSCTVPVNNDAGSTFVIQNLQ